MKKLKKKLLIIAILILVIAGIAVYLTWSNLDNLVGRAIEHYGSQATGTTVNVGSVTISLTDGAADIHDITVSNPPGYHSPFALRLEDVSLALDISSLTTNAIVIKHGVVDGMVVHDEFKNGTSNLKTILNNIQQYVRPSTTHPASSKQTSKMKYIVKNFSFTNGAVTASLDAASKTKTIRIPDISIHDIGVESGGVSAGTLAKQLLQPVIERIRDKVRSQLKQRAKAALHKKEQAVKKKAKQKLMKKLNSL